jgi:hypothetical protein
MDSIQSPICPNDFHQFNLISSNHSKHFCRACGNAVSSRDCDEDGYTNCCSSIAQSKNERLKECVRLDIVDFFNQQHPSEHFFSSPQLAQNIFLFTNLNSTIFLEIDVSQNIYDIINKINR